MSSGEWFDVGNQVLIFSIFALSLNLLMGYAGQVSIAHAAFGAIGGYTAGYLSAEQGVAFLPALAAATGAALVVGVLVSLPALRLAREYLILLTLAVQTIVLVVVTSIDELGGLYGLLEIQNPRLLGFEFDRPQEYIWLLLAVSAGVFGGSWWLGESPFGRVLRGIREDEMATRSLGKNVFAYKIAIFGITSAMAGIAGAMLAFYANLASPGQFGFDQSMAIIAMVIVGGLGNPFGSILGATVIVGSDPFFEKVIELEAEKASLARLAVYGLALVVVLLVRPQGLIPERASRRRAFPPWRKREREQALSGLAPELLVAQDGLGPGAPTTDLNRASSGPARQPRGATPADADGAEPIVEVADLTKHFGGIHAVDHLGFTLQRGLVTGLIGPNGAGKSTVFNLLTGTTTPDAGTVKLNGRDITGKLPNEVARLGMVRSFQDVRIYPKLSALQNVMMGVQDQDGENLAKLFAMPQRVVRSERRTRHTALGYLEFVGLGHAADQPARTLAFGEQKLVALARILATEADVLLLDEPSSGIDAVWVDRMLEMTERLRGAGKTICIVEHNLHVVERVADKVYFMEEGHITAHGTMAELIKQERLREAYFGIA